MKQFKLFLLLMIIVMMNSCSSSVGKVKIGFLVHTTASTRWVMDIAYVKEKAKDMGVELILKDAGGDENVQLRQAQELINEGVDVIAVVAANQNTAAGIVRAAHENGVKVIAYDRLIKNADLDYIVSFEYNKVGEQMINYAMSKVPSGNYVVLWGDASDANAIFIKNGHEKALTPLEQSGRINVVYKTFVDDWTDVNAKHQMDEILNNHSGKIDVVIASNDPIALGAYKSLLEHGYQPGEVLITGQDATIDFVHSMLKGGMTMSVYKPIRDLAYGAVEMMVEVAKTGKAKGLTATVNNGRLDVPAKLYTPSVVDKFNLDEKLISTGIYTREKVYNY